MLNWDTVLQPENDLFQPNFPENYQISALFRTPKSPKISRPFTVNFLNFGQN